MKKLHFRIWDEKSKKYVDILEVSKNGNTEIFKNISDMHGVSINGQLDMTLHFSDNDSFDRFEIELGSGKLDKIGLEIFAEDMIVYSPERYNDNNSYVFTARISFENGSFFAASRKGLIPLYMINSEHIGVFGNSHVNFDDHPIFVKAKKIIEKKDNLTPTL